MRKTSHDVTMFLAFVIYLLALVLSGINSESEAITVPTIASYAESDSCTWAGATTGVAVALSVLVVLPVGLLLGCCAMRCLIQQRGSKRDLSGEGYGTDSANSYEVPVETAISLTDNRAYAHVTLQRS